MERRDEQRGLTNAANAHAGAGKGAEGRLGAGARGLGADTTGGAELDVEGVDAELLAALSNVLRGKHGRVGRGLVTVSLDLHATGDTDDSLPTHAEKTRERVERDAGRGRLGLTAPAIGSQPFPFQPDDTLPPSSEIPPLELPRPKHRNHHCDHHTCSSTRLTFRRDR